MKGLIIIILLLITSCSLEKRLDKYCKLCPKETTTVVEVKDTTIFIPGSKVTVVDSLYCDSLGNVYSIRLSSLERENLRLSTRIINNKMTSDCISDTVYKTIPGINKVITKTITLPAPKPVKYIPSFINFLSYIGGIFLILLAMYLVYHFIKKKS